MRRVDQAIRVLVGGVCLRAELQDRLGLSGGAMARLLDAMTREELVSQRLFASGQTRYGVLRLTPQGMNLAVALGCQMRKSEWDILAERHNAERNPKHAFAVLLFAYQARRRGWEVTVCPPVAHPRFAPDVLVEKEAEQVYVEVEVYAHKNRRNEYSNVWVRKWITQNQAQGRVAVCTMNPVRLKNILEYLRPRFSGVGTELATLAKRPESDLWLERW